MNIEMIKKILPISIFVLILIIIILIGIQRMIQGGGNSQGTASITPTLVQGRQGIGITPRVGANVTPSVGNQVSPEELQKKLPIVAPDFTLSYSPRMQKYVASINSEESQLSYEEWVSQNPSYQQELQEQNVIISQQSLKELNAVLDEEAANPMTPEKKAIRDTKALNDIITNVMNLPQKLMEIQGEKEVIPISQTPTAIITAIPSLPPIPLETPITAGSPNNLLPNPLNPLSSKALQLKNSINPCLANRSIYESASSHTGMPWEILAAIHYIEGGCGANKSLASGRIIGTNEPDIMRGGGCEKNAGPGLPTPLPGNKGCGFLTLLDSAIFAADHLRGKIGKIPSNFQELVMALSWYNGGGNSNCGKTPYANCPKLFNGEDDPYALSMFDEKHAAMYLVYCADLTRCNPPRLFTRPGVVTVIRLLTNQL